MDKITKDMTIGEIFEKFPEKKQELAEVLLNAGLGCVGCAAASFETLEQGLSTHGMSDEDVKKILMDLNFAVSK